MMGLLDPTDDPRTMGLLSLGMGLLGSKGSFGNALSQAGPQALQAMRQVQQDKQRQEQLAQAQKMQQLQMQQAQMQMAEQQRQQALMQGRQTAFKGAFVPGMPGVGSPNGDMTGDFTAPGTAPSLDMSKYLQALVRGGDVEGAMPIYQSMQKDTKPIALAEGGELRLPDGTLVARNAKAPDAPKPTDLAKLMAEMNALPPGSPLRAVYSDAIKKATTHQPAASMTVNTAKPFLNTIAEGLGKNIDASLSNAQAAIPAIQTAQTLKQSVDSGKLIAGPGSTFRVLGLQVGQMLGVGGKDGAEVLSNTRTAIQSMAKAELDAAAQMKGQGQITEAERGIIKRAAAGDIDSLTAPEIRLLAEGMEKTARFKIKQHQANVDRLGKMKDAGPIIPFYSIDEPPAYSGGAGAVRKFNPATGRIE